MSLQEKNKEKGKLGVRNKEMEKYVGVKLYIASIPLIYSHYLVPTYAYRFRL